MGSAISTEVKSARDASSTSAAGNRATMIKLFKALTSREKNLPPMVSSYPPQPLENIRHISVFTKDQQNLKRNIINWEALRDHVDDTFARETTETLWAQLYWLGLPSWNQQLPQTKELLEKLAEAVEKLSLPDPADQKHDEIEISDDDSDSDNKPKKQQEKKPKVARCPSGLHVAQALSIIYPQMKAILEAENSSEDVEMDGDKPSVTGWDWDREGFYFLQCVELPTINLLDSDQVTEMDQYDHLRALFHHMNVTDSNRQIFADLDTTKMSGTELAILKAQSAESMRAVFSYFQFPGYRCRISVNRAFTRYCKQVLGGNPSSPFFQKMYAQIKASSSLQDFGRQTGGNYGMMTDRILHMAFDVALFNTEFGAPNIEAGAAILAHVQADRDFSRLSFSTYSVQKILSEQNRSEGHERTMHAYIEMMNIILDRYLHTTSREEITKGLVEYCKEMIGRSDVAEIVKIDLANRVTKFEAETSLTQTIPPFTTPEQVADLEKFVSEMTAELGKE